MPNFPPSFDPTYSIFEPAGHNGIRLTGAACSGCYARCGGGLAIINRQREMRPSPDGDDVLFTRIVIGQTGNFQALPIVGALTPNGDHYDVTNARGWSGPPCGESKQWTPDGKGVIIQGGAFEAGNVDDILVDLSGQTWTTRTRQRLPGHPAHRQPRLRRGHRHVAQHGVDHGRQLARR